MAKITRSTAVPKPLITHTQALKRKREADIEQLCMEHEAREGYIDDNERKHIAWRYDEKVKEDAMFSPSPPVKAPLQQLQTPLTRPVSDNSNAGGRYNIWLDKESHDKAKLLGNGNVSMGIRIALRSA